MKTIKSITIISLIVVIVTGFSPQALGADKLKVITTHETLKSLAEEIGGNLVEASSISKGTQDPHFISAKPSYMAKARRANLWIRIGMEMEIGYERLILDGARNARIRVGNPGHLDASENVMRLEVPTAKIDRSMGDVHPQGNPHYWIDPWNGRVVARSIADRLSQLDPANANTYESNYEKFEERLDAAMFGSEAVQSLGGDALWAASNDGSLDALLSGKNASVGGWVAKMLPVKGMQFVSYHKSWIYLANRFGMDVPIELEPKPGIPPGPGHVLNVIKTVKAQKIPLIIVEPYYNRKPADGVAEKTGARVVVLANSVGGSKESTDYIAMITNAVDTLAAALK